MVQRKNSVVLQVMSGDTSPDTLEYLYENHRERLLRFVLPRLNGDRSAAEDIVQETFTAALVSFGGFRSLSSPYTWLCSIAQHKIADHYRKQSPNHRSEELSLELLAAERNEPDDSLLSCIEQWMEKEETRTAVHDAMGSLTETYADVLKMKYFEGLSVVEISRNMERSPKSVEGLLSRARHALSLSLSDVVHV